MTWKNQLRYYKTKLLDGDTGNTREVIIEKSDATKRSTDDPKMICFEAYNPNNFEIYFDEILRPEHGGLNRRIKCSPDSFAFVPHSYFTINASTNKPIKLIKNYGEKRFIGNKKADI